MLGDGRGEPTPLNVTPAAYVHPRVSPNGLVLAVGRNDGQSSDIWTYELSGKTEIKRLTFEGNNRFPVWAGDRRVAFQSTRESFSCDQIFILDFESGQTRLASAARGKNTCSYFLPGDREILFASTHHRGPECPPPPD